MKSKACEKKSAITDFNILYEQFFGQLANPQDEKELQAVTWNAFNNLQGVYGLDEPLELIALALSVNLYPKGLLTKKYIEKLCITKDSPDVIESLQKKGFIRKKCSTSGHEYIVLTDAAHKAFDKYEPMTTNSTDFIGTIWKADSDEIITSEWLNSFKKKIADAEYSDFTQAWNRLKINELCDWEMIAFCLALRHFIHCFTEPQTTTYVGFSELVQKGLLECVDDGYLISPTVAEAFLHGHDDIVNYTEIAKSTTVITSNDLQYKELFYSEENQRSIDNIAKMLEPKRFERAKEILIRKKHNPAIQLLLWGGPGTGKTEAAKQIALRTGRDIFLFDVSKVMSKYVGESEKQYRKLFKIYRYIVSVKTNAPILLFNEADQVFTSRLSSVENSCDVSQNAITDILLQGIEDMHGILLATTNHVDMLDEAFDRRFLFKTELKKPDAHARKLIWKSMIQELLEEEAEHLAQKYNMTGAQISNVVTKRDMAELYYDGDRGLNYIEGLCEEELTVEKKTTVAKCGFK